MKYRFEVQYDSVSEVWTIVSHSDNVEIPHSGSSYLRIRPNDKSFHGTIACNHHDLYCYDGGLKIGAPLSCQGQHLNFFVQKVKP